MNLHETAKTVLTESVINLFISDTEQRRKYADDVWDILQKSYAPIGGIKGNGFESKEVMIEKIPMWKILKKSNKPVAVILYKDKAGRKSVALGTLPAGKSDLAREFINDLKQNRAMMELSKAALSFMIKLVGYEEIKKYAKTRDEAEKLLKKGKLSAPNDSDPEVKRHPQLKDYMYLRELGGHSTTKILIGTSGNEIIDKNKF